MLNQMPSDSQNLRSKTLIIQNRDGSLLKEPLPPTQTTGHPSYRVEIPAGLLDEQSSLIERVIAFAFDTLGARRVDVRVRESE
jgi:hypothetical protein